MVSFGVDVSVVREFEGDEECAGHESLARIVVASASIVAANPAADFKPRG